MILIFCKCKDFSELEQKKRYYFKKLFKFPRRGYMSIETFV